MDNTYFTELNTNELNSVLQTQDSFAPKEIIEWCINNYYYDFNVTISQNVVLSIATTSFDSEPDDVNDFMKIIQGMIRAFPLNNNSELKISYYPTHFMKTWNNKDVIEPNHVNSGYTRHTKDKITIVIFRKEESKKVLIHELIHALSIHCVFYGTINNISSKDEFFDESIVETWACILNLFRLSSPEFNIPIDKPEKFYYLFDKILFYQEREFCIKQAARLLKQYGCNYSGLKCIKQFQDKPAILSYYIIKAALLSNPKKFVEEFWWDNINKCKNISLEQLKNYLINNSFQKSIEYYYKHSNMYITMRMTKHGDF
tara:strand:- start:4302 stop:5246 length:945 start_codon:yes stop_codon:yes gene_type:complete